MIHDTLTLSNQFTKVLVFLPQLLETGLLQEEEVDGGNIGLIMLMECKEENVPMDE